MLRARNLFVSSLVVGATTLLSAQTPDTATLYGTVSDPTSARIAGAEIVATDTQTGVTRTVHADASGQFALVGLPTADSYDITATKDGFATSTLSHVTFVGGSSAHLDLRLAVSGGTAAITVTGAAGQARIDQPQLGDTLSREQIEETPLYGRKITYLALLNAANRPAINQGDVFMNQPLFTTNGAGRRQQYFEIDGVSGNDSWGRQTIFTAIPQDAVQEMSVLTNSFSAEYGASTGAVVNIITKSGSNRFHGDLLELWRPSRPEAALSGFTPGNAASGNDITNDSLGQTAASLSGPLAKKTFFLTGAEFSRQDRASPVISPLAPGNYVGHYRQWLGYLRLDHELNATTHLFYRGDIDAFSDTNPNGIVGGNALPTVARVFHKRTYANELGATTVLSPALVNNARAQFQLASPITEFDPVVFGTQFVVPIVNGGSTTTFTNGTSQSALLMNRQYQFNDTISFTKGRNQLSIGGDVLYAHTGGNSKEFGGPVYLGSFTFKPCTISATQSLTYCETTWAQNIGNALSYTQSYGNAAYTVDDVLWAGFVQDDLRLKNLTLNFGLRYERQTFTDSTLLFAPRVGFVYNPLSNGQIVIRGGFGIYDSQIVDNSQANYSLVGPTGVFNYTAQAGQVGFPTSIAAAPLPAFPAGAPVPLRSLYIRPGGGAFLNSFFPTNTLVNYPDKLVNPYSEQYNLGIEHQFAPGWTLAVDYVGTHTLRITRPLDVDAPASVARTIVPGTPATPTTPATAPTQSIRTAQAANCTRPYWISWYQSHGGTCDPNKNAGATPPYSVIQTDSDNGVLYYNALDVNINHTFAHGFSMLASYTWSHTIDNVDPDTTSQNPNDPLLTGKQEIGNAIFDQRHRLVLSGIYVAPFKIHVGGVATLAGGLPYNIVTGTTNSGDTGATTDRPLVNGAILGRDTGRGRPIYELAPFVSRSFGFFHDRVHAEGRAEAFNVLNHANFIGYNGTYGNGVTPSPTLGAPLAGITNQLPARSLQFSAKVSF
ncbi:hypothetical protein FTO74_13930 [Granulicella sp. WH15]|uniref:TonB-dependent receptor n=1 Tax=Granulicella sp. WH15 TaxID=2602070 RepID=UPI001366A718|nr:carboxypeptidase regulatory-like domain-containing protein [Granulicella sp. WH15]QHN04338.1 hypothetical protein FTO74_13930 [Granulicella sp. WH15]